MEAKGGDGMKEVKIVTFFVGRANGRGLYDRSKAHVIGAAEPGYTLCGLELRFKSGTITRDGVVDPGKPGRGECLRCLKALEG